MEHYGTYKKEKRIPEICVGSPYFVCELWQIGPSFVCELS